VSDLVRGVLMKEIHEKSRRDRSELPLSPASLTAPIVGRQKELALVMNHYQAAKAGRIEVVLLTGEPGIGKTRLLDEIALQCAQDGAVVLHGNASEAEGMPPFLPFLEALGRYIRATPQDQIRTQVATLPQMLVSLLPELAVYLPDLHIPQPLLPEQSKFRLYEAVGSFLESINTSHPLVIIIDNLQWADSASLDLLCYLAHHQSNAHLLILGAYRESEVDRNPALARTLTELSRQRVLTTVVVTPLSPTEIGMLATSRYGGSLSPAVIALLHAQSEGNPFFAEELLAGWIESGALKQKHQQWVAVAPLAHALPPTIVGALRQRFARLAPAIIDHLRVAAIIGRSFDPSLLALVEGQEIEAVEECLLEAARAGLIRADQQGRFLFSHNKIRECLYSEVSTSRRRRLHERIGHVLEAHYGQGDAMSMHQLADLAFHYARSDNRTQGVHYSLRAATQAVRTGAAEEAMSHYRTTLELLGPDDRGRGNILLDLGEAALWAGKEQEAETIYEAAQSWLLQTSEQDDGVRVARAAHGLGLALWRQEKGQEAQAALEHALAFLGDRQCAERVKILVDLSQLLMIYMRQDDESLTLAKQLGDTISVAYCLTFLGWVELSQGNALLSRSFVEESIALCREMGLPAGGMWVLGPEVVSKVAAEHVVKRAAAQGGHATARAHLEEGITLAWELGAHSQLGEEAFATAWTEGRGMTPEQALAAYIPMGEPISGGPSTAPSAKLPLIHPDGLTSREVEVLGLVAQGLTNEQVAEQLVISSRTVNTHLTAIYRKIGVSSRSAATRYAIEHHLI